MLSFLHKGFLRVHHRLQYTFVRRVIGKMLILTLSALVKGARAPRGGNCRD